MVVASISFVFTEKIANDILAELQRVGKIAVRKLKLAKLDISMVFVADSKIKQLNKLYRKKDKITDVLSFFYGNEAEVFICLRQAARQAKQNSITLLDELVKLTIHGLAHIAGYDHKNNSDYEQMKKIEEIIYDLYQKNN